MATSSSSGFSYAQAAKGRAQTVNSQSPSSKVTSGSSTPVAAVIPDSTTTGNWAEDVEATVSANARPAAKSDSEPSQELRPTKDALVERTKVEDKVQNAASVISSPDLGAASSTTTREDDSSVAANGSQSESTWETKSQSSDPAWIAERKERQNASPTQVDSPKDEERAKEPASTTAARPSTLHDAPLPVVNPWLKRAEESKARLSTQPPATRQPAPTTTQKPDGPKEAAKLVPEGSKKTETSTNPSTVGAEASAPKSSDNKKQQSQKISPDGPAGGSAKSATSARVNLPHGSSPPPPSVKDEISWPTPELAAEKERREVPEKEKDAEKAADDSAAPTKTKKKEWTSMVVTPNIIFETQNIRGREASRGGERGGRGGLRGRGSARGGAYAGERAARAKEDDHAAARGASGSSDRDSTTVTSKTAQTSASGTAPDAVKETRAERNVDARSGNKKSTTINGESHAQSETVLQATEGQRAKSPKASPAANSVPTDRARGGDNAAKAGLDTAADDAGSVPVQPVPSEVRKETRPTDTGKEPPTHPNTRGAKRGGRGRGGSREFANGHQTGNAYANGHSMDFSAGHPGFAVPPSPSGFPGTRGNHSFSHPPQGRGGWPRGAPRTPSLPVEGGFYQQRFSPYGQPSQLAPIQTYYPSMYDLQGYPMSAMPFQQYTDQQYLIDLVGPQLEYYFCTNNLLKDMFLRKNMDSQGFVFLDVIANFNRIKQLMADKDILRICCMNSENIEICVGEDGKERLRKREGWEQFVLPMEHRNEGARTEGPQRLQPPERPQQPSFSPMSFRGPVSAGPHTRGDRRSYDASIMGMNEYQPQWAPGFAPASEGYADMSNGEDARGRAVKSNTHENGGVVPFPADFAAEKDNEPDAFPDEQTPVLTVVVKMNQPRSTNHPSASRTFSNGSIDSRSIFSETERRPSDGTIASMINGDGANKGQSAISRGASPVKERSADPEISLFWMKDQSLPSESLPSDVSLEPYTALRLKALDQRSHAATGTCPYDLDVLYQFWCHFLIRNFNSRMYSEFKYFANEDAKQRHSFVGLQNLVKFFAQALLSHNPIRDRILRDYVELVNTEPSKLDGNAFKQLRSAWRNGALNLKNRKKLTDLVDATLKERLEA